jgi:hypothetical protein
MKKWNQSWKKNKREEENKGGHTGKRHDLATAEDAQEVLESPCGNDIPFLAWTGLLRR